MVSFFMAQERPVRVAGARPHDRRDDSLIRTAWRWHGWYLPAGLGTGLLVTLVQMALGDAVPVADPWPRALALAAAGLAVGALMALLVSAWPRLVRLSIPRPQEGSRRSTRPLSVSR
jgi:hypothetical protein